MQIFLISITVVSSILMILVILLQQGKGAGLGAAFGSGAQGGLFEASGKANFLSRATSGLAAVFLLASLALSIFVGGGEDGVFRELQGNGAAEESVQTILPEEDSDSNSVTESNSDSITEILLEADDDAAAEAEESPARTDEDAAADVPSSSSSY